jgi:hypothetical protein
MTTFIASFASEQDLVAATPGLRALGRIETFTPSPLESDLGRSSVLPLIVLIAGIAGASVGFALQVYAEAVSYPVNIGGRPEFSWPAFVPIAFEVGVLCAVVAGFVGYLVINRLPRLYDPVDEALLLRGATRDRWCIALVTDAPEQAYDLLRTLSAEQVEELPI